MSTTFCTLFTLANLFLGSVVALAQDKSMNGLEIKITEVSRSGSVTVKLRNGSKDPIKVWQESNSWGAARWRILRIRRGQMETFFQNPNQRFTRNIPIPNEIAAGAQTEQKLNLNGETGAGSATVPRTTNTASAVKKPGLNRVTSSLLLMMYRAQMKQTRWVSGTG
jgi:hypothetical protein